MPEASIQPSCLLRQHDRNAAADGVGELGGARDQLLLLRIVFEWSLSQRADQNFQQLRIDAARRAVWRVAPDVLQHEMAMPREFSACGTTSFCTARRHSNSSIPR